MKLDFQALELRLTHPWELSRSKATSLAEVGIVRLSEPGGMFGLGEAAPVSRYSENIESVRSFVQRLDRARLSFENWRSGLDYVDSVGAGNCAAKSAVATALLDGAARMAEQPLYQYLGLGFSESSHVTSFTIGIDRAAVIREKVQAAEQYPVLKMKMGVSHDAENLAVLREVAPRKPLRVDANEAWETKEQALERIQWLASDGHIEFVEQPMPAGTPSRDLLWLKERSPLPIFADESYLSAAAVDLVADCFHGVNVKLVKAGGVYASYEALQAARARGLRTMIGCMVETSVGITAAAHLAELCDYLDLDGNLLITNDPYEGVSVRGGCLSFSSARDPYGVRVSPRA